MLVERSGDTPTVAPSARIAPSAQLVGNVQVGEECVIDHGAVIASSGPRVLIGPGSVVMANAVIRSVGGAHRPEFPMSVGEDVLVGPLTALVGCTIEAAVYIATGVMVFQGAFIGGASRLGAGSIAHVGARLPARSRVGMRHYVIAGAGGEGLITADLATARELLAKADFFGQAFDEHATDLDALHRSAIARLRAEASEWSDLEPGPYETE